MTSMVSTSTQPQGSSAMFRHVPGATYRLEGEFREVAPVGAFADGIRFLSSCAATVVSEVPRRVSVDINGLISPPAGSALPSAAAIAAPGFEFPDLDFRVTGSGYVRSTEPQDAGLDGAVVSIEGWVNFESGELAVEARPL